MYKYEITGKIEEFAPLQTQEEWDCSGWIVDAEGKDEIQRVMLCLTVTDEIYKQAVSKNCDMIISHHPCFFVPLKWKDINIYCAHTNLDKACGGTTDVLANLIAEKLGNDIPNRCGDYLRILNTDVSISNLTNVIKNLFPNARIVNNVGSKQLRHIAFCAGSGGSFIEEAHLLGADCLITGDLKFHTALESPLVLYDIGHFESEVIVLPVFETIIGCDVEYNYAVEKSPFSKI